MNRPTKHNTLRPREWGILVTLLLWAFVLWSTRLAEPFIGRHDNNSVWISLSARNYWREGHFQLGFVHLYNADPAGSVEPIYYVSTPPLPALTVSLSMSLFGDHELSTRIVSMWLMLIGAAGLFALARRLANVQVALISAGLFLLAPMVAYYGQMSAPELYIVPLLILVVWVYRLYLHKPSRTRFWILAGLCYFFTLSGWPASFALAGLALHALFFSPRRWRMIALVVVMGTAAHLSWILPGSRVVADFWELLFGRFIARTSGGEGGDLPQNLLSYLWQLFWTRARPRYTEALFIFSAFGAGWAFFQAWRGQKRADWLLALLLLLPGGMYVLLFREAHWAHDYLTLNLAPGLALTGAVGIVWIAERIILLSRRQQRVARLIFALLLLAMIGSAARWTWTLYREVDFFPVEIAPEISARVPAGEALYSNIPWFPAVWYYAGRDVRDMNQLRRDAPTSAYVMLCEPVDSAVTPGSILAAGQACQFEQR